MANIAKGVTSTSLTTNATADITEASRSKGYFTLAVTVYLPLLQLLFYMVICDRGWIQILSDEFLSAEFISCETESLASKSLPACP